MTVTGAAHALLLSPFIRLARSPGHRLEQRHWGLPHLPDPGHCPRANWTWYATGPGIGIQIEHGEHAGRLVECGEKSPYERIVFALTD